MEVTKDKTALAMGSGDLEVLATPAMIALMENAAMKAAAKGLNDGQTTVGISINCAHTRATPMGATISAAATLIGQDGRKMTYEIVATDAKGEIGRATHERFVVDSAKFMAKL